MADALRVALPPGTHVAYGHEHLRRSITWVRTLATRPYSLDNIEHGALVIKVVQRPKKRRRYSLEQLLVGLSKEDEIDYLRRVQSQREADASRLRETELFNARIKKLTAQVNELFERKQYKAAERLSILALNAPGRSFI